MWRVLQHNCRWQNGAAAKWCRQPAASNAFAQSYLHAIRHGRFAGVRATVQRCNVMLHRGCNVRARIIIAGHVHAKVLRSPHKNDHRPSAYILCATFVRRVVVGSRRRLWSVVTSSATCTQQHLRRRVLWASCCYAPSDGISLNLLKVIIHG